jgi:hypothetical protein
MGIAVHCNALTCSCKRFSQFIEPFSWLAAIHSALDWEARRFGSLLSSGCPVGSHLLLDYGESFGSFQLQRIV